MCEFFKHKIHEKRLLYDFRVFRVLKNHFNHTNHKNHSSDN
jgi:hypothetical protein